MDDARTADLLSELGQNLLRQQKWAEAEQVLREGLAIDEAKRPDAWSTCCARSRLGSALLGQEKYADAEPLLLAGYDGMKRRPAQGPPDGQPRLAEALGQVVRLYDAWGKPDEAARWRKEQSPSGKP